MKLSLVRTRSFAALALAAGLLLQFGVRPCPAAQDTRVLTLPAPAAGQARSPGYRPAEAARVRGLMWKATSATNTVYLVGSIHFGSPEMYPLPELMESAFKNSSVLVLEVDLSKVDRGAVLRFLSANGMYPEGDTLWNHVSARTKDALARFCSARGINPEVFSRFKPWAAGLTVSTLLIQSAGFQPDLGIDMHFLKLAAGKRVDQMESLDQQLRMLSHDSAAEQERALAEAAGDPEQSTEMAALLKSAWIGGDAKAVETLVTTAFEKSPGSAKRLFGDRNPHMAAEVERYLKGAEPCFVVIGAGHLVGPDGVVAALKAKGFAVSQVLPSN